MMNFDVNHKYWGLLVQLGSNNDGVCLLADVARNAAKDHWHLARCLHPKVVG